MSVMWNVGDIFESCYDDVNKGEFFKIIEIDPNGRYSEKDKTKYISIPLFGHTKARYGFGK